MKNKTKRLAVLSLLTALALILSFVESQFPPIYIAVPGIKMGLPNIIIIFALYKFSFFEALSISLIRVLITSLLFSNAQMFIYSLFGAVLSLTIMVILKKTSLFTTVGISIAGGVFHNLGQIIAAVILLDTIQLGYYMSVLLVTGSIAGVLIGLCAAILLNRTKNINMNF